MGIENQPKLSASELARVADIVREESGIAITEAKAPLVHSRLSKRLSALSIPNFSTYFDFVCSADGHQERRQMLSALTTNVTRFYREPHHFEQLKNDTLPPLLKRARTGDRVRIWSAGCSSGEEPYSIGMAILDLEPKAGDLDIRILASDIDPAILSTAKKGTYTKDALASAPAELANRYFEISGDACHATATLRSLISFRELNLIREWPMSKCFDIIFCRNVIIYFDAEIQANLMTRFYNALNKDGALFIGHSERVSGPSVDNFKRYGLTSYKRN